MLWTSGDNEQPSDRIHRIGQTRPASIFYGVCPRTIDDLQYRLLEESRKVVSDVMEGADDAHDIKAEFLDTLANL